MESIRTKYTNFKSTINNTKTVNDIEQEIGTNIIFEVRNNNLLIKGGY